MDERSPRRVVILGERAAVLATDAELGRHVTSRALVVRDPFDESTLAAAIGDAQYAIVCGPITWEPAGLEQGEAADFALAAADSLGRAARQRGLRGIVVASREGASLPAWLDAVAHAGVPAIACGPGILGELGELAGWVDDARRRLALPVAPSAVPRLVAERRRSVRSIQRMRLSDHDTRAAADAYFAWLPRASLGVVRTSTDATRSVELGLRFLPPPLLVLRFDPSRSDDDVQVFAIERGLLVRPSPLARFEFRRVSDGRTLLTAIHDFAPALPWPIYCATQAIVHAIVMAGFARHLATNQDRGLA